MPQLDVTTFSSQLFWLMVCFFTLYLLLSFIALPKIRRVLETRENTLEERINKASLYREEAESLLAEYEAALANAKREAQDKYRILAQAVSSEMMHKQKEFLGKLAHRLHHAEQDLYRMRQKVSHELKSAAEEVAVVILERMTGRSYLLEEFKN